MDARSAPIDRYVVTEHLSEGGMGAIYVGKRLGAGGFEMEVVLKQLLPEFTLQEEFIELFLREAKLSATLDHANIVHTIDLVTAGGEYFIVMEYLPGGDLRTLLKKAKRRGKRFSPAAAIYICREVLSALAYAHVKRDFGGTPLRLIHRDVSPSNILVSYTGEVKLTDFGIAKAATHNSLFYKVKGKVGYMSPEQAKSEPLDHRSDLYSLAVCMHEVLTGERLFVHAGLTTSAEEIYSQPVPQISRKVPGLPAEFDAIMAKALALSPDARYQTAGELNEALTRCAHRNGLLMAAPELSKELLVACGPTAQWREDDDNELDDDDFADVPRAGTEVYDANDDEELGSADLLEGSVAGHSVAGRLGRSRPARSRTEVGKFAHLEMTSIINMIEDSGDGAKPLVDLNFAPRLDSGARILDLGDSGSSQQVALRPSAPGGALATPPGVQMDPVAPGPPPPRMRSAPLQARAEPTTPTSVQQSSPVRPWMVFVLILLLAGIAAMIVAMSGPDVGLQHGKY